MPVTDLLRRNAREHGDEVALIELNPTMDDTRKISFKEFELVQQTVNRPYRHEITWQIFDEKSNRVANMLLGRGIKKGDKVAILMFNCLEWLPIYFGILKTGAIAVPFNFRYTANEISYCADLAEVSVMFFGPEFVDRISINADDIANNRLLLFVGEGQTPEFAENYWQQVADYSSKDPDIKLTEEDHAAIYFSSGTTGFPKAILHPHRSLTQAAEMEAIHHETGKDDCFLCIPPLYHTGAKFHWMGSLWTCSKAVLLKGTKPDVILKAVSDEKCTIVWLLEYFPKHQYDTNYGLSESTGPGCVHLGLENTHKVGAIGVPGYRWECKIVDDNGEPVKQGEVGELCVKGPGVMLEYYRNPEATAATLRDGWLFTGDMARQDEDGFYFLVDRKKDLIVSGGENIYPVEIENFLQEYPKVKDVAVIGLPDKRLGEITGAIVEIEPGSNCTVEELEKFCNQLPRYKRPKQIILADVPRNATGKIEKPLLRKRYGAERLVEQENQS